MTVFQPSPYQQAIFDWIQSGSGNAFVDAAAGSGKSTTLVHAAALLPRNGKALFCAFNRHITKELRRKLDAVGSSMDCRTIHGLGRGALFVGLRIFKGASELSEPSGKKYTDLCRQYISDVAETGLTFTVNGKLLTLDENLYNLYDLARQLKQLVDFVRLTLTKPTDENLLALIEHYDLEIDTTDKLIWQVLAFFQSPQAGQCLCNHIRDFFKPEEDAEGKQIDYSNFIVCCTVHKAKGLEAKNIFIESPDLFPHPAAKKSWQLEQEYNIEYVALTRAQEKLYLVGCVPGNIVLPQEPEQHTMFTGVDDLLAPLIDVPVMTEVEQVYPSLATTVNLRGDIALGDHVKVTMEANKHQPETVVRGIVRRIDPYNTGECGYLIAVDDSTETIEVRENTTCLCDSGCHVWVQKEPLEAPRKRGCIAGTTEPTKKKDFRFPLWLLEALKSAADESGMNDTEFVIEVLKRDERIQQKLNKAS